MILSVITYKNEPILHESADFCTKVDLWGENNHRSRFPVICIVIMLTDEYNGFRQFVVRRDACI